MKTIYFYIKIHNKTGLKYFGKTMKSPHKYKGSGKYWKRHIKKHGYNVNTLIIATFNENDKENMKKWALEFSKINNIVESKEWANLIPENGLDGGIEIYSNEFLLDISKNFKYISDFYNEHPSLYVLIHQREIQNKCFSHMKRKKPITYWKKYTDTFLLNEAKKFKTIKEFKNYNVTLYNLITKRKLNNEAFKHIDKVNTNKYTNEFIISEAKKFNCLKEFRTNKINLYNIAKRRNINLDFLKEIKC